jgi:hypothetical protein
MTNPLKSHKKIVDKSIRQNVRQSVIIHLAPKRTRQKRRPPLSNSSKSLEVRHLHLYNTPSNPISKDNTEELIKIQMEMKLLREERTQINNDLHRDKILASSFTENNPILQKDIETKVNKVGGNKVGGNKVGGNVVSEDEDTRQLISQINNPVEPRIPTRTPTRQNPTIFNKRTPEQLAKLKLLYPDRKAFPANRYEAQILIDKKKK